MQVWLSVGGPRSALWAAGVQSAGTLFFNVTTFAAMHTLLSDPEYDRLVWRPDALGSICFLVSGVIAYVASPRHGWRPQRGAARLVGAGASISWAASSSGSPPWRGTWCRRAAR